jgi:antirestriction protein ArdC
MLPLFETCRGADSYYATLAHETTHRTAHESRLARDFGTTRFGSEGYAIDELVAELGAAFLCADLDLTREPREDHAAYIANWLQVLKADNRDLHGSQPRAASGGLDQRPAAGGLRRLTTDRGILGSPYPSY